MENGESSFGVPEVLVQLTKPISSLLQPNLLNLLPKRRHLQELLRSSLPSCCSALYWHGCCHGTRWWNLLQDSVMVEKSPGEIFAASDISAKQDEARRTLNSSRRWWISYSTTVPVKQIPPPLPSGYEIYGLRMSWLACALLHTFWKDRLWYLSGLFHTEQFFSQRPRSIWTVNCSCCRPLH